MRASTDSLAAAIPRPVRQVVAGGLSGILAKSFSAPFDRVKILLQTNSALYPRASIFRMMHAILLREGVRGLFVGNWSTIVRIAPYSSIQFFAYEEYKRLLGVQEHLMNPLQNLVAGSLAGSTAVMGTYPLDVIRTKMAVSLATPDVHGHLRRPGVLSTLANIYRKDGLRGCFSGLPSTLLGIFPYGGTNFMINDLLKFHSRRFFAVSHDKDLPISVRLMCGGIAATIGQTVSYPLDVVRRKQQVSRGSIGSVGRTIWQESGWRGFFKGLSINYIKVVPMVAISFTTYDSLRGILGL